MSCSICFSDSPDQWWTTQNVRYSWLVDQMIERLRPEEEELRQLFQISAEIHFLAFDSLLAEDRVRWKRGVEVLADVVEEIVQGRLPPVLAAEERADLELHYSKLQRLLRAHILDAADSKTANQTSRDNAREVP